ncbi:CGNR zinc finger domain-containing protein [uncultured Serinicoccus sp.]|uniref:CGNR zinc finger domain-containing protein n=1 Tax=uncultured Serinicoccus sp. TaxID=735514 RepID=UPI002634A40B|nr:CGNR zinc finger domain-containing protein [uncultured Serinicoccus sp.]
MPFTHDAVEALRSAAALVNTRTGAGSGSDHLPSGRAAQARAEGVDTLTTVADLEAFVRQWQWSGTPPRRSAEVQRVRLVRPRLATFWELGEEAVVDLVNVLLAEERAVPRLVDHDGWGWHLHAVPDDAPFATRMAVEAAMAMVDVVRADELQRLRRCEADGCDGVFVDLSRNRSKRFCSTACGNRVAAAAYRGRQSDQGDPGAAGGVADG